MRNKKNTVLVLGSSNIDIVVRVDKLPSAGETVLGEERREYWGGKGANQALAAVRSGAEVRFVTMLGNDAGGDAYGRYLVESGVSPDGILRSKASTGAALIVVDKKARTKSPWPPGANALLTPGRIRRKAGLLDFGDVVLAQLEVPVPSVVAAFERGRKRGACNILNPAPIAGELPREVIRLADVLAPNETEAAHLAELAKPPETDESSCARHAPCGLWGLRGSLSPRAQKGLFSWMKNKPAGSGLPPGLRWWIPRRGRCFCGALAARFAEGAGFEDAVRFAVSTGSCSVKRYGAQAGLPSRRQIMKNQRQVRQKQIRLVDFNP